MVYEDAKEEVVVGDSVYLTDNPESEYADFSVGHKGVIVRIENEERIYIKIGDNTDFVPLRMLSLRHRAK